MCEPTTIALVAGGVLSAAGAYQGAQAQKAGYEMQAAVGQQNARVADDAARRAQERGDTEQQRIGRETADLRGKQRAVLAANGVDLGFGSAADTLSATDYYGAMDSLTAARNTDDEEYNFRQEAANQRSGAAFASGSGRAVNPWMAAGGTLLSSAGKVNERWTNYKKAA